MFSPLSIIKFKSRGSFGDSWGKCCGIREKVVSLPRESLHAKALYVYPKALYVYKKPLYVHPKALDGEFL